MTKQVPITKIRCVKAECILLQQSMLTGVYSCPNNPKFPKLLPKDFAKSCQEYTSPMKEVKKE